MKFFDDFETFKNTKKWAQWDIAKKIVELKGQTLGIIGYGSIGKDIAKKANKQIKNAHNNKPPSRLPHHAEKRYMVGCDFDDTVAT